MPSPLEHHVIETTTGERVPCELGAFEVPESRDGPGRGLRLRFVRLRSVASSPGSPIVFLSGGPGDSGVHWARHPQFLKAFQRFRAVADVILLDQRGCGLSEPNLMMEAPTSPGQGWATSRTSMLAVYQAQGSENVARFGEQGWDLASINVVESAHDLADLREALGVPKLSLIGYSYGSHLALNAIRQHEDILDKVVLCGWEGPDDTLKLPSRVQRQLESLDAHWQEQGGEVSLLAAMKRVHRRLADEPVRVAWTGRKEPIQVGTFALQHLASTWMGVSNRFVHLPQLYRDLDPGNTETLAKAMSGFVKTWRRPATFFLTDGASSASPKRLDRIALEAPDCLLGDAASFPFPEIARTYGAKDLGPAFWEPISGSLPILAINGTLDGNTPVDQAAEQMAGFPRAQQHIVRNCAHNDMLVGSEVHEAISEFLVHGHTERLASSLPEPLFRR